MIKFMVSHTKSDTTGGFPFQVVLSRTTRVDNTLWPVGVSVINLLKCVCHAS